MKRFVAWWRQHFLGAETGLAALLCFSFAGWITAVDGTSSVNELLLGRRTSLYGTVASIHATLLGFALATTAIVLGFAESERFTLLRESRHYPTLWRTLTSAIRVLGMATIAALGALVFDREPPNTNVATTVVCAGTSIWAVLRVLRSVWALEKIIRIATTGIPTAP